MSVISMLLLTLPGKIGLCGDDSGDLPATENGVRKNATFLEEGNVVEDVSNEVLGTTRPEAERSNCG